MTLWQDVVVGLRGMRKHPGLTLIAALSIAIGVGASASMFSVADTLVLRPLTLPRASELMTVTAVAPRQGFNSPDSVALSYPEYLDIRDRLRSLQNTIAYRLVVAGFAERAGQPAQRRFGLVVSGNLFEGIDVTTARLGRLLAPTDDRPNAPAAVVLDHDTWVREFASDPGVLGRSVTIGSVPMTIVGVAAADFAGPDQFVRPAFYVAAALLSRLQTGIANDELQRRDLRNFLVKGRLTAGATTASATAEAAALAGDWSTRFPATNRDRSLAVRTEVQARVDQRPQLAVLSTMLGTLAAVVLLIACTNVTGLLTSQVPVRAREMALRLALGARQPRLVRQLVVEGLLLASAGGALGVVLAEGVITLFRSMTVPTDVPLKLDFALDGRVLAMAAAVATVSALVSSLGPAWRATRTAPLTLIKSDDGRSSRLLGLHGLVFVQVVFSVVLLASAVFLYRAYQQELGRGPGFRTDRVLMMEFDPELARLDAARTEAFYARLLERARTLPGVSDVALTSSAPLDQISVENTAVAPERVTLPAQATSVSIRSARIDGSYFEALDIPLLAGRTFRATDTPAAPRVAIINQAMAERYWPGDSPIGRRFRVMGRGQEWTHVVGVVATTKSRSLSEAPTDFVYYPSTQVPASARTLLVATAGDPAAVSPALRAEVAALEPTMPIYAIQTMDAFYRAGNVRISQLVVDIVGGMGLVGVTLAVIGLYGLVAYAANRRTREIGIRMAVGARPIAITWLVLRRGAIIASLGLVVGLAANVAISGVLRAAFPFPGIPRVDVPTYLVVVGLLLSTTAVAAYLPARRAARIDPLRALREN